MRTALCLAMFLAWPTAVDAKGSLINLQPGLWEITSTVTDGMAKGQSHTMQQCITKEDMVPRFDKLPADMRCNHDHKVKGKEVHWQMNCKNKDMQMNATGRMLFKGKSMSGSATINTTLPGLAQPMIMEVAGSGKYLGTCSTNSEPAKDKKSRKPKKKK